VVRVEVRERAVELVTIGDHASRIGVGGQDDRFELDLDGSTAPMADRHQARVDE
jgi:hypothetical protein